MASRSLGTLTLDLVAKTAAYAEGLSQAERKTQKWRKQVEKDAKAVGTAFGAFTAAAVTGLGALAVKALDDAKELKNLSTVAGVTAESFQSIAYAAGRFGIEQDKVADTLKDTNDKVGDFLQTGGGALADYFENIAPLVGQTAEQFRNLSGTDALQLYVDGLEKANLSQNEMTFYMEAIASDATLLLPLLKNNGQELGRLSKQADEFGAVLDDLEVQQLLEVNKAVSELKGLYQGVTNQVVASTLPAIKELTDVLSDPATIEAAKALGGAVVTAFTAATEAITTTINTAKFLGEEFAVAFGGLGVAADDIGRLEREAAKLEKALEGGLGSLNEKLTFFGRDGIVSYQTDEELQAELDKVKAAIQAYYANENNKPTIVPKVEPPAANTTASNVVPIRPDDATAKRYIAELQQEVELLGKTKNAAKLYAAELNNATDAQKAEAAALVETLDAYDKKQKAIEAAAEAQKQVNDEAENIRQALRTEEEAIQESYEKRRQIVLDNTKITGEARKELLARLDEERNAALDGPTQAESNIEAIRQSLLTEEEAIKESYARRRDTILESAVETGENYTDLLLALEEDRNKQLAELEAKRQITQLQNYETLFGGLASIAKQFKGEQSSAYRALFALEKAAAVARSVVAIQTGIANAFSLPFPANLGAAATVAAETASIVGTIQGTNLSGSAHDGMMSVPETGSYYLKKGERVTTEKTSAKLDQTLDQVKQGEGDKGSGGNVQINNVIDPSFVGDYMSSPEGQRVIDNYITRNQTRIKSIANGGR